MDSHISSFKRKRDKDSNYLYAIGYGPHIGPNAVAGRAYRYTETALQPYGNFGERSQLPSLQSPDSPNEIYEGTHSNIRNIYVQFGWSQHHWHQLLEQNVNNITIGDPILRADVIHMKQDLKSMVA